METATALSAMQAASGAAPAPTDASGIQTIAEDRLVGAAAIARFIDPNMTKREFLRLLGEGHYPCWREGRRYVASKAALLQHWREKTGLLRPEQPAKRQPKNKSARRGYRPA